MLFMTIGEMIAFPFSNAFAMERAKKGNQGEYMALYTIAFSIAHIFGHNTGMQLVDHLGFDYTWYIMTALGVCCALLLFLLKQRLKNKNELS
jgi:predicted MFS family arabinose efflux permease